MTFKWTKVDIYMELDRDLQSTPDGSSPTFTLLISLPGDEVAAMQMVGSAGRGKTVQALVDSKSIRFSIRTW